MKRKRYLNIKKYIIQVIRNQKMKEIDHKYYMLVIKRRIIMDLIKEKASIELYKEII
jgi:hypothetical protein